MNIKQAKEQIKNAMTAYFTKDEYGNFCIPIHEQRLQPAIKHMPLRNRENTIPKKWFIEHVFLPKTCPSLQVNIQFSLSQVYFITVCFGLQQQYFFIEH